MTIYRKEMSAAEKQAIKIKDQEMMAKLYQQIQLFDFSEDCIHYFTVYLSAKYLCALVRYLTNRAEYDRMVKDRALVTLNGAYIGLNQCDSSGLFDKEGNYTGEIKVSSGRETDVRVGDNQFFLDTQRMPYKNFQGFNIMIEQKLFYRVLLVQLKK